MAKPEGCDSLYPPNTYRDNEGVIRCRCLVCSRCKRHTGNNNQGHYWAHCSATGTVREFHFCCPGDCQLETVSEER